MALIARQDLPLLQLMVPDLSGPDRDFDRVEPCWLTMAVEGAASQAVARKLSLVTRGVTVSLE